MHKEHTHSLLAMLRNGNRITFTGRIGWNVRRRSLGIVLWRKRIWGVFGILSLTKDWRGRRITPRLIVRLFRIYWLVVNCERARWWWILLNLRLATYHGGSRERRHTKRCSHSWIIEGDFILLYCFLMHFHFMVLEAWNWPTIVEFEMLITLDGFLATKIAWFILIKWVYECISVLLFCCSKCEVDQ